MRVLADTAVVLAAAMGYAGWVYLCPYTAHKGCKGTGRNVGKGRKYWGVCRSRRCQNGTIQRLGARTVHKAVHGGAVAARKQRNKRGK